MQIVWLPVLKQYSTEVQLLSFFGLGGIGQRPGSFPFGKNPEADLQVLSSANISLSG